MNNNANNSTKSTCGFSGTDCVAKDTMIQLQYGKTLKVSDIKIGDRLACDTNSGTEHSETTDIIKGCESELCYIKTATGKTLMATPNHPILTPNGLVTVGSLQVNDSVTTVDGKETITVIEKRPYNDVVYSLILNPSAHIVMNGFICGDFEKQNALRPAQNSAELDEKTKRLLAEFEKMRWG